MGVDECTGAAFPTTRPQEPAHYEAVDDNVIAPCRGSETEGCLPDYRGSKMDPTRPLVRERSFLGLSVDSLDDNSTQGLNWSR